MRVKKPLGLYFKCHICGHLVPFESDICGSCGAVISYDEGTEEYYITGRVCFKCGNENKLGDLTCVKCKDSLTLVCTKCGKEIQVRSEKCEYCGLRIEERYIENELKRRLAIERGADGKKVGFNIVKWIFLVISLAFATLAVFLGNLDNWIGFIAGGVIFAVLFLSMVAGDRRQKRERASDLASRDEHPWPGS